MSGLALFITALCEAPLALTPAPLPLMWERGDNPRPHRRGGSGVSQSASFAPLERRAPASARLRNTPQAPGEGQERNVVGKIDRPGRHA
jgi:hypothetical protein